jgi:hypothetical protein
MTMLVGSRQDAVNAAALVGDPDNGVGAHNPGVTGFGERLEPRPLTDGRYAVSQSVLTQPGYEAAKPLLSAWTNTTTPLTYALNLTGSGNPAFNGSGHRLAVNVGGKFFHQLGRRSSLTMPHPDVFRFEVREKDQAFAADVENIIAGKPHPMRRSEIVSRDYLYSGNTIWVSFTLVLGDTTPALDTAAAPAALVLQLHAIGGYPILGLHGFNGTGGKMELYTASSASTWGPGEGKPVYHWSAPQPGKGVKTNFVMQTTLGQAGHVNLWVNGTQVLNKDAPIGYYAEAEPRLAALHFCLYQEDQPDTHVVYHANTEYTINGASLAARITAPLSVPDLNW